MSKFLSRISVLVLQGSAKRCISTTVMCKKVFKESESILWKNNFHANVCRLNRKSYTTDTIEPLEPIDSSSIKLKKKTIHKKPALEDVTLKDGHFLTLAYATAHTYDLKALREGLIEQKLYEPGTLKAQEVDDVLVAKAVYEVAEEPREIIFFKEGAVVFWNCSEIEASNVLDFIKRYESESYPSDVIQKEREIMTYFYQTNIKNCNLHESSFVLVRDRDNSLEKYTFSHAMAQSARLGAWEARLGALAASVRTHSAGLERHGAAHVDRDQVIRKLGELFSLRHRLNVESDLLDTPDCYWEDERLERIYSSTVAYFTIPRRTRVLNERLAHCVELLELLSSWASDRHHVRLEWMVIVLIMAEVVFEVLHLVERYYGKEN